MDITSKVFEEDGEKRELVLTLTATAEEVDANIKQFFKDAREQKEIPGFRKGKAPRNVIRTLAATSPPLAPSQRPSSTPCPSR